MVLPNAFGMQMSGPGTVSTAIGVVAAMGLSIYGGGFGSGVDTTVSAQKYAIPSFYEQSRNFGATTVSGGHISYAAHGMPATHAGTGYSVEMDTEVHSFMLTRTGADLDAVDQLAQLASRIFATRIGAPRITFQTDVYDEDEGLQLFMDIDSHGMETEEQLVRDARMRKAIWQDARLRAAKKYVVINVY